MSTKFDPDFVAISESLEKKQRTLSELFDAFKGWGVLAATYGGLHPHFVPACDDIREAFLTVLSIEYRNTSVCLAGGDILPIDEYLTRLALTHLSNCLATVNELLDELDLDTSDISEDEDEDEGEAPVLGALLAPLLDYMDREGVDSITVDRPAKEKGGACE